MMIFLNETLVNFFSQITFEIFLVDCRQVNYEIQSYEKNKAKVFCIVIFLDICRVTFIL